MGRGSSIFPPCGRLTDEIAVCVLRKIPFLAPPAPCSFGSILCLFLRTLHDPKSNAGAQARARAPADSLAACRRCSEQLAAGERTLLIHVGTGVDCLPTVE